MHQCDASVYSVMTSVSSDMNGLNHRWIGWLALRLYANSASEWAAVQLGIDSELRALAGIARRIILKKALKAANHDRKASKDWA